MSLWLFFTTLNFRTGIVELLTLPPKDEIKTVSLSLFERCGKNQKRW